MQCNGADLQGWLAAVGRSFVEKGAAESRALLDRPDLAGAKDLMHRWTGLAGTVGHPELGDLARQVEIAIDQAAPEDQVRQQLRALSEAFELARQEPSR